VLDLQPCDWSDDANFDQKDYGTVNPAYWLVKKCIIWPIKSVSL